MDQNAQGRRPQYQRGRRGQDRRGSDRRTPPAPSQSETPGRESREHVDVEQIMREIRGRIAKGSGVDLSNQQIHELAARRLEAVLDPRTIKPGLLDQLRRGATVADLPAVPPPASLEVEEQGMFDSFLRRLMRPLFATLAPILAALKTQDTINREAAEREAAANRRQAEWNALQFELLQRMVTETSRALIEMQSLALRIESLSAKVDFNERRVRGIEAGAPAARQARHHEAPPPPPPPRDVPSQTKESPASPAETAPVVENGAAGDTEQSRKRRRRRRGRRSGTGLPGPGYAGTAGDPRELPQSQVAGADDGDGEDDVDTVQDDEPARGASGDETVPPPPASEPEATMPAPDQVVEESAATAPLTPAPEQPTPPRDEAAPTAEPAPPAEPPDSGPAER